MLSGAVKQESQRAIVSIELLLISADDVQQQAAVERAGLWLSEE